MFLSSGQKMQEIKAPSGGIFRWLFAKHCHIVAHAKMHTLWTLHIPFVVVVAILLRCPFLSIWHAAPAPALNRIRVQVWLINYIKIY